jgi:hypothetical protein
MNSCLGRSLSRKAVTLPSATRSSPQAPAIARGGPVVELLPIAEDLAVEGPRHLHVQVMDVKAPVPYDRSLELPTLAGEQQLTQQGPHVMLDPSGGTPKARVVDLKQAVDAVDPLLPNGTGRVR